MSASHEPGRTRDARTHPLPFVSAADLRASIPSAPAWIWSGYAAPGRTSLIVGKPKAGKSTLACALAEAVAGEGPTFLGREVRHGPVVYVSEEGAGTLAAKLSHPRVRVLTRDAEWPARPWPELVSDAVAEAVDVGALLLVVDTFGFWSRIAGEAANDAGSVTAALCELGAATRAGLAVVLVHHQRKQAGENGDTVLGSTAFYAAVDALVELSRPRGNAPACRRRLALVGRWPAPPVLEVDYAGGAYAIAGGEAVEQQRDELRERVLAFVRDAGPVSQRTVERELGGRREHVRAALRELDAESLVRRDGLGWQVIEGVRPADPGAPRAHRAHDVSAQGAPAPGEMDVVHPGRGAPADVEGCARAPMVRRTSDARHAEGSNAASPNGRVVTLDELGITGMLAAFPGSVELGHEVELGAVECGRPTRHGAGGQHRPHPVTGRTVCWTCHPPPANAERERVEPDPFDVLDPGAGEPDRWISAAAAAKMSGLAPATLYARRRRGELASTGLTPGEYAAAKLAAGWAEGTAGWGAGVFFRLAEIRELVPDSPPEPAERIGGGGA